MAPFDFHNDYWKSTKYNRFSRETMEAELGSRGYDLTKRVTEQKLHTLMLRVKRDLPNYDACSDQELETSAKDRRVIPTKIISRRTLTQALDRADREKTFNRFFDLPAELRNRIYAEYVRDFLQPLRQPAQPPLAKVSRQLLREVPPIFHQECIFECEFVAEYTDDLWVIRPRLTIMVFLLKCAKGGFNHFRNLRIKVGEHHKRPVAAVKYDLYWQFIISLTPEGIAFQL